MNKDAIINYLDQIKKRPEFANDHEDQEMLKMGYIGLGANNNIYMTQAGKDLYGRKMMEVNKQML